MLEPTKPGFTGEVWESKPPEELARDLVTGAGAVPAAEAGLAWARLSANLGAAALDYDRILGVLSSAWESKNSTAFIERIRALREWLAHSAASAAGNAVQAETHAAAYEIARLAMPDAGDVEKLRQLQEMLEKVGTALGAPMLAKLATVDGDADAAKAVAARVMRTYEAATESLATPWEHQTPPPITEGMNTTAAPPAEPAPEAPAAAPGFPGGIPSLSLGSMPLVPVNLAARTATTTNSTTKQTVVQPVTVQSMGSSMPMAPMAGAQNGQDEEHTTREGLAGPQASDAELGLASGMQVAPSVLGGVDPNAQRSPDIAFSAGSTGAENTAPGPAATRTESAT
ncbi:PPE domain-containing protein [Nocardia sp. NPDC005978]|uniref:PPE domain-containing protein n=1 Tax=Nocardia sp. NPDC005978 TaxID=3156725 RepID=UPI0033B2AAB1